MFSKRVVLAVALGLATCACCCAAEPKPAVSTILDTSGSWRVHNTLKPPVTQADDGLKPSAPKLPWLELPTASPPANWTSPDFDDSSWLRGPARRACFTPYLARLCLRGKFVVNDPAQVQGLTASVFYCGGAIVYLNGKEIGRNDLPAGAVGEATLANPYPLEAYVDENSDLLAEDGTYTANGKRAPKPSAEAAKRIASRVRSLKDLAIPSSAVRRGVNVLAVEIIRAPYHKVLLEKDGEGGKRRYNKYDWNTCQIHQVQLTAAGAEGLVANAVRPDGLQIWNTDTLNADVDLDWGDPCEVLQPIKLVGAKNGKFSGKVVVGSTKPIQELTATVSDLRGDGGTIQAANVRIRYGICDGVEVESGTNRGDGLYGGPYDEWPNLLGLLVDKAPAEVVVRQVRPPRRAGAVAQVWATVKAPADVKPGTYSGALTIQVKGEKPLSAGIQLKVLDWALPDPQNFQTWVELIEVPDTLALEYQEPLWSEKHLAMIAKSFELMSDSGTRVIYIPAIAHTNLGNAESMIRWIRKGEKYEWDFSVMDKYLDLAQKHLGTPKIVVLQVWEVYMQTTTQKRFEDFARMGTPQVTLLDPATGKTENGTLPKLSDPASKPVWQALLAQVRERLRKRGLEKALMYGMFTDLGPSKEDMQFFNELAPDLPWVHQGHGRWKTKVHGIGEVGYQATVWGGFRFADGLTQTNQERPPVVESLHGWKEPRLDVVFERNTDLDGFPIARWRFFAETGVTAELRGIGRLGADYWRAIKNKSGRRVGWVHDRFREGSWGGNSINLNLCNPVLGPGPDGPGATTRLVALIEGVQECEARILLERALTDPGLRARIGPDLAGRCEDALKERLWMMWKSMSNHVIGGPVWGATAWRWVPGVAGNTWFLGSGWQARSEKLYALAGEVAKKTGK